MPNITRVVHYMGHSRQRKIELMINSCDRLSRRWGQKDEKKITLRVTKRMKPIHVPTPVLTRSPIPSTTHSLAPYTRSLYTRTINNVGPPVATTEGDVSSLQQCCTQQSEVFIQASPHRVRGDNRGIGHHPSALGLKL